MSRKFLRPPGAPSILLQPGVVRLSLQPIRRDNQPIVNVLVVDLRMRPVVSGDSHAVQIVRFGDGACWSGRAGRQGRGDSTPGCATWMHNEHALVANPVSSRRRNQRRNEEPFDVRGLLAGSAAVARLAAERPH